MKAKIVVDGISLLSPLTGIGRYTYEISKYLKLQEDLDLSFFYGYYSKSIVKPNEQIASKQLKSLVVKNPFIKKLARRVLFFSSNFIAPSCDIYWQPNFIPNKGIKAAKVVTSVHDFSAILYKDFHTKERIEYFENHFFKNIYKSDMIITGSEFTKSEILNRLDFKENNIKVIYHGIDHQLFKVYENTTLDIVLPKKFIFSAGSIEPRKNLLGLLKAYNTLDANVKETYKLVLAGFKGWENKEIMEIIQANKENIMYLGFVSDIELSKIYNLSTLFVYPSFYEGFGLPPLEAMACGTPVITSNISSLPEVGGDAVVYCNPYDVEDIKNKIVMVLSDKKLQKEMIQKGLKRAKEFTWEKSAQEHMRVFQEVLHS